jgi:hypothetical protein
MHRILSALAVLLVLGAALLPLSVYAIGVPLGGIVTAETPCHVGTLPAVWLNILGFDFVDVLAPPPIGTLPFLYGIPVIGHWILGQADTPITCLVGTVPLPPGLRLQMFGTSPVPAVVTAASSK